MKMILKRGRLEKHKSGSRRRIARQLLAATYLKPLRAAEQSSVYRSKIA